MNRLGIWSAPTERQRRRRFGFLVSDLEESRPGRPGSWPGGTRADRDRCLDGSAKAGSPLRSAPALHNVDKGLAKPGLPRRSPQGEGGFMSREGEGWNLDPSTGPAGSHLPGVPLGHKS